MKVLTSLFYTKISHLIILSLVLFMNICMVDAKTLDESFNELKEEELPIPIYIGQIKSINEVENFLKIIEEALESKDIDSKIEELISEVKKYDFLDNDRPIFINAWSINIMGRPPLVVIYLPVSDLSKALEQNKVYNQKNKFIEHKDGYVRVIFNKAKDVNKLFLKSSEKFTVPTISSDDKKNNFHKTLKGSLKFNQVIRDGVNGLLQFGYMANSNKINKLSDDEKINKKNLELATQTVNKIGDYINGLDSLSFNLDSDINKKRKSIKIGLEIDSLKDSKLENLLKPSEVPLELGLAYDKNMSAYFLGRLSDVKGVTDFFDNYSNIIKNIGAITKKQKDIDIIGYDVKEMNELSKKFISLSFPGSFAGSYHIDEAGLAAKYAIKPNNKDLKLKYDKYIKISKKYFHKFSGEDKMYKSFKFTENVREHDGKKIDQIIAEVNLEKLMLNNLNSKKTLDKIYPDGKIIMELSHDEEYIFLCMGKGLIDSLISEPISKETPEVFKNKNNTGFITSINIENLTNSLMDKEKQKNKDFLELLEVGDSTIIAQGYTKKNVFNIEVDVPINLIKALNKTGKKINQRYKQKKIDKDKKLKELKNSEKLKNKNSNSKSKSDIGAKEKSEKKIEELEIPQIENSQ